MTQSATDRQPARAPANETVRTGSATASGNGASSNDGKKSRRRKTGHLKIVPETRTLREQIRSQCAEVAAKLDKAHLLSKDQMESIARRTLEEMGLAEGYVGWTMVVLSSEFWQEQVAAIPPSRRLLLLPHCLKHAEGCPADYDQFGLDCEKCGACSIADFRTVAESLGYKVLVAEGSPIVLKIIISGYVDAIVGVACLNVLEKAIDKILLTGIPCMAVPLLSSDCRNTSVDEDWVQEMIHVREAPAPVQTRTYLHLMRAADGMFEPAVLESLAPRVRGGLRLTDMNGDGSAGLDPIAATEAIAYDFLTRGGKHSRPFITLAVYDAMTGGQGTLAGGAEHMAQIPEAVRRAALSIETFHKASLVHDDIEDDDDFRYGEPTLHRKHGLATAINAGDYLIGLGYRLVSREATALGPEATGDVLDYLAEAHMRLCEGQGAELVWRDSSDKAITPIDALKIYALKTAPAFEAAFYSGVRLAGPADEYREPIKQLARHLGIAFQILNDLKDWEGDSVNNRIAGGDVLGGRPTVLWALALEGLGEEDRTELGRLLDEGAAAGKNFDRVRELYHKADVFEKAHRLVDKYQERAEAVADEIALEELRRLCYYLIDTVLDRPAENPPELITPTLPSTLPLAAEL